jgi:putative Mg2+ transporter-C (MgtC) family protein
VEGLFEGDIIVRLLLAAFFGSTIGVERYIHGRPAGLRTYLVVCVAFASIAILSERLPTMGESVFFSRGTIDPGRLMAGGLTGIGFLGAGIIIRGGLTIHGLTTAAGIWGISVVGLALGSGVYDLAASLYLIILVSLMGLRYFESFLKKDTYKILEICTEKSPISYDFIEELCHKRKLRVVACDISEDRTAGALTYRVTLNGKTERSFREAYQELASLENVRMIQLTNHDLG